MLEIDKIDAWFNSEEGKESIKRYKKKLKLEVKREKYYLKKLKKLISSLNDEDLGILVERFTKWEREYQEMYYKRCIETSSNILGIIWLFFKKNGKYVESDEMFCSASYQFKNYEMSIFHGQGSFLRLSKIEKTILL